MMENQLGKRYNKAAIDAIFERVIPAYYARYAKDSHGEYTLSRMVDWAIIAVWVNGITLSFEEDLILRRAARELRSPGYITFEG